MAVFTQADFASTKVLTHRIFNTERNVLRGATLTTTAVLVDTDGTTTDAITGITFDSEIRTNIILANGFATRVYVTVGEGANEDKQVLEAGEVRVIQHPNESNVDVTVSLAHTRSAIGEGDRIFYAAFTD